MANMKVLICMLFPDLRIRKSESKEEHIAFTRKIEAKYCLPQTMKRTVYHAPGSSKTNPEREKSGSTTKSLKEDKPWQCKSELCDYAFSELWELEAHQTIHSTHMSNGRKQETQMGWMKRQWFSKYGAAATDTVSHNRGGKKFMLHLEELERVTLPAHFPEGESNFVENMDEGFALHTGRDKTLNRPTNKTREYLQELFDAGQKSGIHSFTE